MRHEEDDLQMSCVKWFTWTHPKLARLLHHSPNGGRRNLREAARFKAMGTKAGFPDLFLAIPCGGSHGLFIEMKTAHGRQSEAQKVWQGLLEREGYRYEICRSIDEFRKVMYEYLTQ